MRVITGNDLKTGDVLWWSGDGWSALVDEACDAGDEAEQILAREEAARRINVPYIIEATRTPDGRVRPSHIKDRVRALGPTIAAEPGAAPLDQNTLDWVTANV